LQVAQHKPSAPDRQCRQIKSRLSKPTRVVRVWFQRPDQADTNDQSDQVHQWTTKDKNHVAPPQTVCITWRARDPTTIKIWTRKPRPTPTRSPTGKFDGRDHELLRLKADQQTGKQVSKFMQENLELHQCPQHQARQQQAFWTINPIIIDEHVQHQASKRVNEYPPPLLTAVPATTRGAFGSIHAGLLGWIGFAAFNHGHVGIHLEKI
jgi:hypothetical protein